MTWKTARPLSLTSIAAIDTGMHALVKTHSESWWILSIFSLQNHNSTLRVERDRPLKLHLLWGRKHVRLITIHHKPDCKDTFVVQAGGGIFSLPNSFLPLPPKGNQRWIYRPLSGFIWYVWGSLEGPGKVSWCWGCSYCTVCLHHICSEAQRHTSPSSALWLIAHHITNPSFFWSSFQCISSRHSLDNILLIALALRTVLLMSSCFPALTKTQEERGGKAISLARRLKQRRGPEDKKQEQEEWVKDTGRETLQGEKKRDTETEAETPGTDRQGLRREELNFPTPSVTSPWVESSTYVKPPTTTHQ